LPTCQSPVCSSLMGPPYGASVTRITPLSFRYGPRFSHAGPGLRTAPGLGGAVASQELEAAGPFQSRSKGPKGSPASPSGGAASSALVAQDGNGNRTWMGMGM
jgi:hypothetical protein